MHPDQLAPTEPLLEALVAHQFPQWRSLKVRSVRSDGTVNAIFRIGESLVARLPLRPGDPDDARAELHGEATAANELAKLSPVPTPEPVALGEPGAGYPMPWSVYRWLDGAPASHVDVAESHLLAADLADFVASARSPQPGIDVFGPQPRRPPERPRRAGACVDRRRRAPPGRRPTLHVLAVADQYSA